MRPRSAAIARLAGELGLTPLACAQGIVRVAEAQMLGALRVMSVERGIDPRGLALMPFGGAGPLHAAALARELGISRVLCPRASGVLSALGLAAAAARRDVSRTVMLGFAGGRPLSAAQLAQEREALVAEALAALAETPARVRVRHELRYRGQSFELAVDEELDPGDAAALAAGTRAGLAERAGGLGGLAPAQLRAAFAQAHEQRYGYRDESAEVELVNVRVSAWGAAPSLDMRATSTQAPVEEVRPIVFDGEPLASSVLRGEPPPGTRVAGPALCALPDATLLVPPGWSGEVDAQGTIRLATSVRGATSTV